MNASLAGLPLHAADGQPKNPFTGRIEIRDHPVLVDGEQAGGDRLDHRFDVGTAAIEFEIVVAQGEVGGFDRGLAALQIRRHPVERIDERADFIGGFGIDAYGEIALRDRLRRFSQPLNRHRDAARDIESEPGRPEQE